METRPALLSLKSKYIEKPDMILTWTLYLLMFAYALSVTMIAPLMPILVQQYKLKLSQGGLIMTFQSIGGILAIALGGILADLMKKSRLISIAFIIYGFSLILIAFSPSYAVLLGLFFILGASTRMLDAVINAYISDLHPSRRGLYLALLHTIFGVGAFFGPLFSAVLINSGLKWNQAFLILGIVCIVILLLYSIVIKNTSYKEGSRSNTKPKNFISLIANPKVLILCFIMFMYTGHQSGISTWLPMYMEKQLETGSFLSSLGLSAFWVGIILGRFICSFLSGKFDAKYIILLGSLLGGAILISGIALNIPYVLIVASGVTGFLTGAIIPLLVMIACNWHPQNSGTVSSMIFFYGNLALMVFPWLIGVIAENISFQLGMLVTGLTLLIIVLLALLLPDQKDITDTNRSQK